jgi:Ca2+-binding EF-hand superfamily protein
MKRVNRQTCHFFKRRRLGHHREEEEIDFGIFCDLVSQAGLEVLAVLEVFHLIDLDGSGTIDMKEFSSKYRVFACYLQSFPFFLCIYCIHSAIPGYIIYMFDRSVDSGCTIFIQYIFMVYC